MSKGKKFTAAKKHFQEKEVKLRQEMRSIKCEIALISDRLSRTLDENEKLKEENAKLLEVSGMTDGDLRDLLSVSRASNMLSSMFSGYTNT